MRYVQSHIPYQSVLSTDDIAVDVGFPSPGIKGTHIHVIQNESGGITQPETLHDLVRAMGGKIGEVSIHPVVKQTGIEPDLFRGGHLRFEIFVWSRESVFVSAAGQLGRDQLRVYFQRTCILAHTGNRAS